MKQFLFIVVLFHFYELRMKQKAFSAKYTYIYMYELYGFRNLFVLNDYALLLK